MTYKILGTNFLGDTIYARVDDDGVIRVTCSADHPPFQEWLAEGNEPLPADD
jgi:hypothetical protein